MQKPYEDLRIAIEREALARKNKGDIIIESEVTGQRGEWLFDFRALMLQAKWLDRYAEIFWEHYGRSLPFQVGAMETAGISLVSAIVMKGVQRGTPVNGFYIRKSRKRHGLMRRIEGTLTDEPVILVDDLINSGSTFRSQIAVLEDERKKVAGIFSMLAFRDAAAYRGFAKSGIPVRYLFTLEDFGIPLLQDPVEAPSEAWRTVWRYRGTDPSFHNVLQKAAPVIDGTRVYLGCEDGVMRALLQENGALAWEFRIGKHPAGKGILSTPALHEGVLYFGAYDGSVYALEAETGTLRWRNDDADWIGSSPALSPEHGMLYIGLEFGLFGKRGGIAALDMRSGETRWKHTTPSFTHGSPLYIAREGIVVVGSNDGVCYAHDAQTGAVKWRYKTRGDIKTAPAYDADSRSVFVPSMDGSLYALNALSGEPRFAFETAASIYSIPLVHDGTVYVASLDKTLYALDAQTGERRWIYETRGRMFGAPVIADGSLYIGSNDGCLYELDPKTGAFKSAFQASERIMNAVAYNPATKRIFTRTVGNELYCLAHA